MSYFLAPLTHFYYLHLGFYHIAYFRTLEGLKMYFTENFVTSKLFRNFVAKFVCAIHNIWKDNIEYIK